MVAADTSRSRSYVSALRRQQAADTRERIVRAAAELFAERGFAGTTMPGIARRAGVSTETVQSHGPKIELLRAAIAAVSFGGAPGGDVVDTELGRQMLAATTPSQAARVSAEVLAAVNASAHGVWMTLSEAARTDPTLADELRSLTEQIAAQTAELVRVWRSRGWLRTDLSTADLVRRATLVGSVELWDRFVRIEGGDEEEYRRLLAGMLVDLWMSPQGAGGDGADESRASSESEEV